MRRIKTSYSVVTKQSVRDGDFAETGWEDGSGHVIDPDADDIEEHEGETAAVIALAVAFIREEGGTVEASSSRWHRGTWYTQLDIGFDEQCLSFHLEGFEDIEEQGIYKELSR